VVDDGSSDQTAAAAREVPMPSAIRLEVVSHPRNLGKGAAVRTGFQRTTGAQILLSDADLSAPIDELDVLARSAPDSTVRIGSRALNRQLITVRQPIYRDLMGRVFNLTVRSLVMPGIHDTQCGFKLFPGDLGRALAAVQTIDGFAFDVELMYLARRWGVPVVEVPVHWRHVEASRVQPGRHSLEMLTDLVRLWWRGVTGKLPPPPPGAVR